MPPRPPQRERLRQLMDDRRLQLGLTWEQVAATAQVSYEAIRAARNDNAEIRPLTRAAIDRGLRWEVGSVARVLDEDGDPVPLESLPAEPPRPRLAAVPDALAAGLPEAEPDAELLAALAKSDTAAGAILALQDGEGNPLPWSQRRELLLTLLRLRATGGATEGRERRQS